MNLYILLDDIEHKIMQEMTEYLTQKLADDLDYYNIMGYWPESEEKKHDYTT